jgi:PhnB protein
MPTKPLRVVPEGSHTVTPWIIAKGASELFSFIEKIFEGKEKAGSRMVNAKGFIDHVEVQVGDSVIMLFDGREGWPETRGFFRLYVEDADTMVKRARDAGATIITEVTPLFFGDKVGRVLDPWGNIWWIQQRIEELDYSELEKRMRDPSAVKAMQYVQDSLDQAMQAIANVPR